VARPAGLAVGPDGSAPASLVEATADALLDLEGPATAVVAQSDLLASGVILAARERGLRVPEDLSVAGFDGLDLPWMSPDVLTTVVQPLTAKGEALAGMVAALIAGSEARSVQLGTELRIGTTTGPPPPG
jgi:DNA-binding LacI/PurR family transcriptional regulator